MNKYKVFRSLGKVDKHVRKHELIGVECGKDIHAVTDMLMKIVSDDMLGLPQFASGYTSYAYAPERIKEFQRVKRYAYYMDGIAAPDYGEQNTVIEYGIMEETAEDM